MGAIFFLILLCVEPTANALAQAPIRAGDESSRASQSMVLSPAQQALQRIAAARGDLHTINGLKTRSPCRWS